MSISSISLLKNEATSWTSFTTYMHEKKIKPVSSEELVFVKKRFGELCIRKIQHKSIPTLWHNIKTELKTAASLPASRLNHLSYLVHLDESEMETFHRIKELCLSKQFVELEELLPSFSSEFFLQVFLQIMDPSIQLDIIKRLHSKIQFYPYLKLIQKQHDLVIAPILKYEIEEISKEKKDFLRNFNVRELFSLLSISPFLKTLFLELRINEKIGEVEKIEEELKSIPKKSILKDYLIERGVLDKEGLLIHEMTSLETSGNVVNSLNFLAYLLNTTAKKIEESEITISEFDLINQLEPERYNLIYWDRAIPKIIYERFLIVLELAKESNKESQWMKDLLLIRDSKGNSTEEKIEKSINKIKDLKKAPYLNALKEALKLSKSDKDLSSFFNSGPLASLDLGLIWNPSLSFLEQCNAKQELEFLYFSKVILLAKERGFHIDESSLYRSYNLGDFHGLQELASGLPLQEIKSAMHNQIKAFYKESLDENCLDLSPYQIYLAFRQNFKIIYKRIKEGAQDPLYEILAEESYVNNNINVLLAADCFERPGFPESEVGPVQMTLKEDLDLDDLFKEIAIADLKPYLFKRLTEFYRWEAREDNDSFFKSFIRSNGLNRIDRNGRCESELVAYIQKAQDLFIGLLEKEAECLKIPFPENITSLDQIEELAQLLSYQKFLKLVDFLGKKYEGNALLLELKNISSEPISLLEKRTRSLNSLKIQDSLLTPVHLDLLATYLENIFAGSSLKQTAEVNIRGFDEEKKSEFLSWLLPSYVQSSLEVRQKKESKSDLFKRVLESFRNQMTAEIIKLEMPAIFLQFLEKALDKGDLSTLDSLWHEVAYQRYLNLLDHIGAESRPGLIVDLQAIKNSMEGRPIFEKVKEIKDFLTGIEDSDLANRLLFELEKTPYILKEVTSKTFSKSIDLISSYLDPKNKDDIFYKHLKNHRFSPLFFDKEVFNWFSSLQELFIRDLISLANSESYSGTGAELLIEELSQLDPFDFRQLDNIAKLIKNKTDVNLQKCANLGFKWGVEKSLRNSIKTSSSETVYLQFSKIFEAIPEIETQKNILNHLIKRGLKKCVQKIINSTTSRSKQAAFEFLKDKIEEPGMEEKECLSFLMEYFFEYDLDKIKNIFAIEEAAKNDLETLDSWLASEGSYSSLKLIFNRDGFLDSEGRILRLFSSQYTLNQVKNAISMAVNFLKEQIPGLKLTKNEFTPQTFNDFDAQLTTHSYAVFLSRLPDGTKIKEECTAIYNNHCLSWIEAIHQTKGCLETCDETGVYSSLLTDTFKEMVSYSKGQVFSFILEPYSATPISGFSDCLKMAGVEPIEEISLLQNYEFYDFWESEIFNYITEKAEDLIAENYEGNLAYKGVLNNFKNTLIKLKKERKWSQINELVDQVVYVEYQIALSCMKPTRTSAVNKILTKQNDPHGRAAHQMIGIAKENLSKLGLSTENQKILTNILEKKENWKENLEKTWTSLLDSPLKILSSFQTPFSEMPIYKSYVVLDMLFTSLGMSLKENVKDLRMNLIYHQIIERAQSSQNISFLFSLCNEISYKIYLNALQKSTSEVFDIANLIELNRELSNLGAEEKIKKTIAALTENLPNTQHLIDLLNWKNITDFIDSK